jgi:predicted dinucleotide-binding enzyme
MKKKYGILGTGNVAKTIGAKLIQLGHEVKLGSRNPNSENALNWIKNNGPNASVGTFKEAASFSNIIFNCLHGINSIEAIESSGKENFKDKILVDLANPYNYVNGHIILDPKYSGNTSLGEEIQKFLPNTKVVKTLNYLGFNLMTNPGQLNEPITGFYCGNNNDAKEIVNKILHDFGWTDTFDIGDISMSKYTEMLGAFWVPIYGQVGNMNWGLKLVRELKKK